MRELPWLLGGGVAGAAFYYYWTRREREAPDVPVTDDNKNVGSAPSSTPPRSTSSSETPPRVEQLPGRWVWPVAVWRGRKPEISDGFASNRRTKAGDLITHGGVDIMYRRQPGDVWPPGTPHGTRQFVMPDDRAALAASDGIVSVASNTPRGWAVIIDHAPHKLTTHYTHLSSIVVAPNQKVSAGTPIGIIGADPLDGEHIMHLHFELRRGRLGDAIDPKPLMASWEYLPDPTESRSTPVARNTEARRPRGSFRWDRIPGAWPRRGLLALSRPTILERTAFQ